MVSRNQSRRSKAIQQRTGRTFHVATRFLPERVRDSTYVLYAFFRIADEVVDDPDPYPPAAQRARLDEIEAAVLGTSDTADPVLQAMAEIIDTTEIPDREIETFMDAMRSDVSSSPYETFADLETYLRGSAVAVAYMMLHVMDPPDVHRPRPHAKALGEAFQLTNFLRDVREDAEQYNRVYIPESTLERYGVSTADVLAGTDSSGLRTTIRAELQRTEDRYRTGVAGIRYLPHDCQFPVLLAAVLYAEHHAKIRANDFDVMQTRHTLSRLDYARLVAKTWWAWKREPGPDEAFYRASAIDPAEETNVPRAKTRRHPRCRRLLSGSLDRMLPLRRQE